MNSVNIIGNLTKPVELKQFGETTLANMSVALNERVKKDNDWIDKPIFIEVTVFGKQATNCGNFLSQGSKVGISGKLDFSTWQDKETGKKRSKLSVIAHTVTFLTPKGEQGAQESRQPTQNSNVPDPIEDESEIPF